MVSKIGVIFNVIMFSSSVASIFKCDRNFDSFDKVPCQVSAQGVTKRVHVVEYEGLVHTRRKEFENGGFRIETYQMFTVHTTPEGFKNATVTGHFGYV